MPHPLAGKPAPRDQLIDPAKLEREYHERRPDPGDPGQLVSFGTSGHRGNPLEGSFNEAHILAITQAICEHRKSRGLSGPLFMGKDTHAASAPAERTALEVLAANGVEAVIQGGGGATPTPVISRAILRHNHGRREGLADGIVITPSHNPPSDGGFKYNPPHGGPADTDVTEWVQDRANALLREGNSSVKRLQYEKAVKARTTHLEDFVATYVAELGDVLDLESVRSKELRIGVDPLGGSSAAYWGPIAERYSLKLTVVNETIDPTFRFMPLDHDGRIRMDCSSPYAMANLVRMKDRFDIAFGADPDADRHGIVTRSRGLLNPNHYLAAAIGYLLAYRPGWPASAAVGKTLVSSGLIDRVVEARRRKVSEVPVGFKWFAQELLAGTYCFGGEESAGASFLRKDGTVWTTDKDGLLLCLLSAEITARTGKDPGARFEEIVAKLGMPYYTRLDAPATPAEKDILKKLAPEAVTASELAGEPIVAKLTRAPGNGAPIGGLKVVAQNGWFAARPSGTENLYKIYAESFRSDVHLQEIVLQARDIVARALIRS